MTDYILCLICNEKIIKDKKKFRTHTRNNHSVYIYDYEQMFSKNKLKNIEYYVLTDLEIKDENYIKNLFERRDDLRSCRISA